MILALGLFLAAPNLESKPVPERPAPPAVASSCRARARPVMASEAPGPAPVASVSTGSVLPSQSSPWVIQATYDPSFGTAELAVLFQAQLDWLALIEDQAGFIANPYPVHFIKAPLGGNLVLDVDSIWVGQGQLTSSTITFDQDTSFFVDPTPSEDSEFTNGTCAGGACNAFDLLTVARHGVGHAFGWTGHFDPNANPWVGNFMPSNNGTTFDPALWRIPLDPSMTSHVDPAVWPEELMTPTLPTGVRRGISLYPDLTLIARSYNFQQVVMKFMGGLGNFQNGAGGTAMVPYLGFPEANTLAPPGYPVLVRPYDYYFFGGPLVLDTPHVYFPSRGSGTVVLTKG